VSEDVKAVLEKLLQTVQGLKVEKLTMDGSVRHSQDDEWIEIVRRGEKALYVNGSKTAEVTITDYGYTKNGMTYTYKGDQGERHTVPGALIMPINGETSTVRYNTETGEIDTGDEE
jgi:hypothetical protein